MLPSYTVKQSLTTTVAFLLLVVPVLVGCNIFGPVQDVKTAAVNALDDAIDQLANESAAWQQVLNDTVNKLTDSAQSDIRNEVSNLLAKTISTTGAEFRCNADFVGTRVREALERIKIRALGGTPDPIEPALCEVVPIAVERALVPDRVSKVEFYGYDFDLGTNLAVYLERSAGPSLNVTNALNRPTPYAMTLSFGASGVQLDSTSQRIRLEWNGNLISTIAVIQPTTPVCESKLLRFTPASVTYVPPHKQGDKDFGGHGPNVHSRVTLKILPTKLKAEVYMRAKETKKDWTRAEGSKTFDLYTPDPGWRIDGVVGDHSNSHSYTDDDKHNDDSFGLSSGGPVKRLVYVGDTDGEEAGTRTKVGVTFNELRIQLSQSENCISATDAQAAVTQNQISPALYQRLRPDILTVLMQMQPL